MRQGAKNMKETSQTDLYVNLINRFFIGVRSSKNDLDLINAIMLTKQDMSEQELEAAYIQLAFCDENGTPMPCSDVEDFLESNYLDTIQRILQKKPSRAFKAASTSLDKGDNLIFDTHQQALDTALLLVDADDRLQIISQQDRTAALNNHIKVRQALLTSGYITPENTPQLYQALTQG